MLFCLLMGTNLTSLMSSVRLRLTPSSAKTVLKSVCSMNPLLF